MAPARQLQTISLCIYQVVSYPFILLQRIQPTCRLKNVFAWVSDDILRSFSFFFSPNCCRKDRFEIFMYMFVYFFFFFYIHFFYFLKISNLGRNICTIHALLVNRHVLFACHDGMHARFIEGTLYIILIIFRFRF